MKDAVAAVPALANMAKFIAIKYGRFQRQRAGKNIYENLDGCVFRVGRVLG